MDFILFTNSLTENNPPSGLSDYLIALWYDGKGEWETAHTLINDKVDRESAWVHAYLHRKEGDSFNAAYWYRKAGKAICEKSLEAEWEILVTALLRN